VRVIHMEGPGCYGHNGADDVALDAALLANSVSGRAVSVKWMRFDEHAWEPYGPAMLFKLQASLDEQGKVIDWNHDVWSYTHLGRARPVGRYSGLVASWQRAESMRVPTPQPTMWDNVGEHRNADPYYTFPKRRIAKHFIAESPLRTSSLRSLGGMANVFAVESFVDEVAHAAGMDPLDFRLQNLKDERARAVLQVAAEKADWEKGSQKEGYGRGVSFARYKNHACYVAAVAEVSVNRDSGQIAVERVLIAADVGQIVNPDGLSNQLQGAFLQGTSLALKEKVGFDPHGVNTLNWFSYPILRFTDVPQVEVVLINRPGAPYLGAGEGGIVVAPSAIANAIYDAVGIRLRSMPFTPERVREAIKDQLE
jgi:nicotinate dehydrogenase subunit B